MFLHHHSSQQPIMTKLDVVWLPIICRSTFDCWSVCQCSWVHSRWASVFGWSMIGRWSICQSICQSVFNLLLNSTELGKLHDRLPIDLPVMDRTLCLYSLFLSLWNVHNWVPNSDLKKLIELNHQNLRLNNRYKKISKVLHE